MVVAYEDSFVCIEGAILLLFLVPLGSFGQFLGSI